MPEVPQDLQERTLRDHKLIVATIQGRSPVPFTNVLLEGPMNVPTRPYAFMALYPVQNGPTYRLITMESMAEPEMRHLRERALAFRILSDTAQKDREKVRELNAMPSGVLEQKFGIIELALALLGYPICFILFGRTEPGRQEVAYLYYTLQEDLPAIYLLEKLQNALRNIAEKRGEE